ncbi:MAG: hypothetical protein ACYS8Z_17320, partial [Planctomycetota bacterium]
MRKSEEHKAEDVRGAKHRKRLQWKFWILPVGVLVLGLIAGERYFRRKGLADRLRVMAEKAGGEYREEIVGSRWYAEVAEENNLPVVKRPVMFGSHQVTDEDLAIVGKAHTLREVDLRGSQISDVG